MAIALQGVPCPSQQLEPCKERDLARSHELVILRDHGGNLLEYIDTELTKCWRRNLTEINDALCGATLGLNDQAIRAGDPLRVGTFNGAAGISLHRVFNRGRFSLGGRLYGGWWQNIPKEFRADITIDGSSTIELDYPRLHPTLLYCEVGQSLNGDPYEISGWDRGLVKVALNTLLNADTRISAVRSIAQAIGGKGSYGTAERLVQQIEAKHHAIAPFFGTSAGLRLMRRDSDMAEQIVLRLLEQGITVLPVHDSFIVPEGVAYKGALMEAMSEALHKHAANSRASTSASSKNIPQYGATCPVAVPWVFVFFPDLPELDLFGGHRLAIPTMDLLSWCGGRLFRWCAAGNSSRGPSSRAQSIGNCRSRRLEPVSFRQFAVRTLRRERRICRSHSRFLDRRCPHGRRSTVTARLRLHVVPGDVPATYAARRLGLPLATFQEMLPALLQRGFPRPDETTGNYCLEAIDQWRFRRFPALFPLPGIEGPKTDRETARARIGKM